MNVVGEVKAKSGRLKIMKISQHDKKLYHKEFKDVDLDRSSLNNENTNDIHQGLML